MLINLTTFICQFFHQLRKEFIKQLKKQILKREPGTLIKIYNKRKPSLFKKKAKMVSNTLQQLARERDIDLTRYITLTDFNWIEKLSLNSVMEDLGKSLLNHHSHTNPNNDHNYFITITFQAE